LAIAKWNPLIGNVCNVEMINKCSDKPVSATPEHTPHNEINLALHQCILSKGTQIERKKALALNWA
jgi:hypothetical protein